jgi:hypothetical protein
MYSLAIEKTGGDHIYIYIYIYIYIKNPRSVSNSFRGVDSAVYSMRVCLVIMREHALGVGPNHPVAHNTKACLLSLHLYSRRCHNAQLGLFSMFLGTDSSRRLKPSSSSSSSSSFFPSH